MPGTDKFTVAYAAAVAAFNQTGSLAESEALFADDVTFHGEDGDLAGRENLFVGFHALKDSGWVSHNLLSAAAIGHLLTITYLNDFSDGRTEPNAAILRFGDDGLIVEVWAISA